MHKTEPVGILEITFCSKTVIEVRPWKSWPFPVWLVICDWGFWTDDWLSRKVGSESTSWCPVDNQLITSSQMPDRRYFYRIFRDRSSGHCFIGISNSIFFRQNKLEVHISIYISLVFKVIWSQQLTITHHYSTVLLYFYLYFNKHNTFVLFL